MPRRVIILGVLNVVLLMAGCGPRLNDDTAASISFAGFIFVIALESLGEETKKKPLKRASKTLSEYQDKLNTYLKTTTPLIQPPTWR